MDPPDAGMIDGTSDVFRQWSDPGKQSRLPRDSVPCMCAKLLIWIAYRI